MARALLIDVNTPDAVRAALADEVAWERGFSPFDRDVLEHLGHGSSARRTVTMIRLPRARERFDVGAVLACQRRRRSDISAQAI